MLYKTIIIIFEYILLFAILIAVVSVLPFNLPLKSYVVVSGSMEPVIKTGSFVFSQSLNKNNLKIGDIIAFISPKNQKTIIIHRIHQISADGQISTKGDNNKVVDDWQITKNSIIGKPIFIIPGIGKFFNLVHTKLGFILIICLPSFIFIILQAFSINSALSEIENKKSLKILALFLIPLVLLLPHKIHALFTDSVSLSGIRITADDFSNSVLSSEITAVNLVGKKIKINYTTQTSDFSEVKVCYSKNLNSWQCFLSDKSALFDPPEGEGIYFFNILVGRSGQFEDKDYAQNYISFQVDLTSPTSSLNLEKSFNNTPFYMSQPVINFDPITLDTSNQSRSINFNLPQKLSSVLYFNYQGVSTDTCDFTNLLVSLNGQPLLQTGPQELGLGNWTDTNGLESFFYQLPVFSTDQNLNLSFNLSPSSSPDSIFTISNISLYPISLRTGNTFTPIISSHDIGSGVGSTNVTYFDNKINLSSKDILENQENNQSVDIVRLPPVVLNEVKLEYITLYKNIDTGLSGYYLSNLVGDTVVVTELTTRVPAPFFDTGTIILNNPQGSIIDKLYFGSVSDKQIYWRRNPDGIGTWVMTNKAVEKIFTSLESNQNNHKILMTISNISFDFGQNPNDYFSYSIDYQTETGPKQIFGKINSDSIKDRKVDREFYLGTCSTNNNCLPENISVGQSIYLTIEGQSDGKEIDKNIWQIPY